MAVNGKPVINFLDGRAIGRINRSGDETGYVTEKWIINLDDKHFFDLVEEEVVEKVGSDICDEDGKYDEDIYWYNITKKNVIASPSQLENGEATYFCENHPMFDCAYFMDVVTYGAIGQMKHLVDLGIITEKDVTF